MKQDVLIAPAMAGEVVTAPPLVRVSGVRQLVARAWWVACMLPALVLLYEAVVG